MSHKIKGGTGFGGKRHMEKEKPKVKWIVENGYGHYKVQYKGVIRHCDEWELKEAIREIEEEIAA